MKILFFRIGAIGDVLLTTTAVKKARNLFPDAEIHYLCGAEASPVLENNPHIDKLFILPKENTFFPKIFRVLLMSGFFKKNFSGIIYDYFIDFESSYFSAYFSFMIEARAKIGHFIKDKRRKAYNRLYTKRSQYADSNEYVVYRHLALIREIADFDRAETRTYLELTPEEKEYGKNFLEGNSVKPEDKKILLCTAATRETKMWPQSHWINLIKLINENYPDVKIIILSAPSDPPDFIKTLTSHKNVFATPLDGLRALAAVESYGDMLIANDGAVRHMAVAMGVKTIGIFGPTNEKFWGFENDNNIILTAALDCHPCHKAYCKEKKGGCMRLITPEMVLEKIKLWMLP